MRTRAHSSFLVFAVLASTALALDLATKRWAERALTSPREVVDGFMTFAIAHNPNGAFSVLRAVSDTVKMPLFISLSAIALAMLVGMFARATPSRWVLKMGLALVIGGALGNLVDRLRYGYVIDFIELRAKWGGTFHQWPTFNVADVAISVGIALIALDRLSAPRAQREPALPPRA
jgi:signal peptidase II